jgi:hypothetical protein
MAAGAGAGLFGGLFGGIPVDENHVSCTMCRCQLPKQNAPPIPTRCQLCAKTLCDAYKRSSACVPPSTPTIGKFHSVSDRPLVFRLSSTLSTKHNGAGATVGCNAGPAGRLRPLREHDIVYPLRPAALRHNAHETKILQDYLTAKSQSRYFFCVLRL